MHLIEFEWFLLFLYAVLRSIERYVNKWPGIVKSLLTRNIFHKSCKYMYVCKFAPGLVRYENTGNNESFVQCFSCEKIGGGRVGRRGEVASKQGKATRRRDLLYAFLYKLNLLHFMEK